MRSIAQFVAEGIRSVDELKEALQIAIRLEFSTIPPYLCAEWSIIAASDPSRVAREIRQIVEQEMFHFALAGNILAAIGGRPDIANSKFIVEYPTDTLPGNIKLKSQLDLRHYSDMQLDAFMNIEYPQFKPIALAEAPATIGDFYDTIKEALLNLKEQIKIDPNAFYVDAPDPGKINTVDDAALIIDAIKQEGEGTKSDPQQPLPNNSKFAHYYKYKEFRVKKRLKKIAENKWDYVGDDVIPPQVMEFKGSDPALEKSKEFNKTLTSLLKSLEAGWVNGGPTDTGLMRGLRKIGVELIAAGVRPEFGWLE